MPSYSNAVSPLSLFPGDIGFSFNNEALPADGTAGSQFAIPEPAGFPDQGHTVRWQTLFGTNPTAVNIVLEGEDERIKQRTWERLVNIGPGRGTAVEEGQQVIWDMPRPVRE